MPAGRWVGSLPAYPGTNLAPSFFVVGDRTCLVSAQAGTSGNDQWLHCYGETGEPVIVQNVRAVVEHQRSLVIGLQNDLGGSIVVSDGVGPSAMLAPGLTLVAGVSQAAGAVLLVRSAERGDELARYHDGVLTPWDDPLPGADSSVERLIASGDRVFVSLYTTLTAPCHVGLYLTDGSNAGTQAFVDPMPDQAWTLLDAFRAGAGAMFWAVAPGGARTLYRAESLAGAPFAVTSVTTQSFTEGFVSGVTLGNGSTLFGLKLAASGLELWRTNGTAGGTALVRDLFEGESGMTSPATPVGTTSAVFACQTRDTGPELCATEGTQASTALSPIEPSSALTASTDANSFLLGGSLLFAENASPWSPGGLGVMNLDSAELQRHDTSTQLGVRLRDATIRALGSDAAAVWFLDAATSAATQPPLLRVRLGTSGLEVTTGPNVAQLGESTANGILLLPPTGGAWHFWDGDAAPRELLTAEGNLPAGNAAFFRVGAQVIAAYAHESALSLFRVDDATLVPLVRYSALAQGIISSVMQAGDALLAVSNVGSFLVRSTPDDYIQVDVPTVPETLLEGATNNVLNTGRVYHSVGNVLYRSIQRVAVQPLDLRTYEGLYAIKDGGYQRLFAGRTRWSRTLGETLIAAMQVDVDRRVSVIAVTPDGHVEALASGEEFAAGSASQLLIHEGRLYFTHDDGVYGRELWVTNGTRAGTTLTVDIAPGAASSFLDEARSATRVVGPRGSRLVLMANDFVHGAEPTLLEPR